MGEAVKNIEQLITSIYIIVVNDGFLEYAGSTLCQTRQ